MIKFEEPKPIFFLSKIANGKREQSKYQRPRHLMVEIALKDALYLDSTPPSLKRKKLVKFSWKGILYDFARLCFG